MRANVLYIVTAILCAAACAKSSDSGNVAQNGSAYPGGAPTGPSYPTDTTTNLNPAPLSPNTINANPALAFNPTTLTVTHGTSVNFVFGTIAHTVTFTSAGAPADIPATSNSTVAVTFPTAGVYTYMCTIHPTMTGSVTVQ